MLSRWADRLLLRAARQRLFLPLRQGETEEAIACLHGQLSTALWTLSTSTCHLHSAPQTDLLITAFFLCAKRGAVADIESGCVAAKASVLSPTVLKVKTYGSLLYCAFLK